MSISTLKANYAQALLTLSKLARDFTPGSDERYIEQRRKVNAAFDELWYAEQREDRVRSR